MSSSVISSFGGSFFAWFQDEVLPYLVGTLYTIILILSIIFNGVLITAIRKRNLLQVRTNRFLFELTILDLISCILFILPSVIVAFMRKWALSTYVCQVHGTLFTMCYLVTFGLLIVMSVERAVRTKNFDLHDRFFMKSNSTIWISVLIWVLSLAIAVIPQSRWASVSYDFYQAACVPNFGNNVYYLSIVFTFGIGFCFMSYLINYSMIFTARKKKLEKTTPTDNIAGKNSLMSLMSKNKTNAENPKAKISMTSINKTENFTRKTIVSTNNGVEPSTSAPKVGWGTQNKTEGDEKPKSKFAALRARDKMKKAVTKVKVSKLFSDDDSDPDFHLSVTYFIVACLMLFLWLPYFIVSFFSVNDKGMWGGIFSIVSVVAMISYCLKPVIYLAHNRHYQTLTKETMPEKVVKRAEKVRSSISEAINKLDKVMFKATPAQKKFNATIKTTIVAKGWLGRARKNLNAKGFLTSDKKVPVGKTAIEILTLNKINEVTEIQTSENIKNITSKGSGNNVDDKPLVAANVNSSGNLLSKQNNNSNPVTSNPVVISTNSKPENVQIDPWASDTSKQPIKDTSKTIESYNETIVINSVKNIHTYSSLDENERAQSIAVPMATQSIAAPMSTPKKTEVTNIDNSNEKTIPYKNKTYREVNINNKLLQKRDSLVDFHYAHVRSSDGVAAVIVNGYDGLEDAMQCEPKQGKRNASSNILETVNVLPSLRDSEYNSEQYNQFRIKSRRENNDNGFTNYNAFNQGDRNKFHHQKSIDSFGSVNTIDDDVFYPSQKPHTQENIRESEPYKRNAASLPPPILFSSHSTLVDKIEPPYTDRNGYDQRNVSTLNQNNRLLSNIDERPNGNVNRVPIANLQEHGYIDRRRNTYQPAMPENIDLKTASNDNQTRMSFNHDVDWSNKNVNNQEENGHQNRSRRTYHTLLEKGNDGQKQSTNESRQKSQIRDIPSQMNKTTDLLRLELV